MKEAELQDDTIHYWNERFGDKCTVVTPGTAWVDFIPFDTNKAKGVEKYSGDSGNQTGRMYRVW